MAGRGMRGQMCRPVVACSLLCWAEPWVLPQTVLALSIVPLHGNTALWQMHLIEFRSLAAILDALWFIDVFMHSYKLVVHGLWCSRVLLKNVPVKVDLNCSRHGSRVYMLVFQPGRYAYGLRCKCVVVMFVETGCVIGAACFLLMD